MQSSFSIIIYQDCYKESMLAMIWEALGALGISAQPKEDLYDVQKNYLDKGDAFWLAIDDNNEVLGCLGYSKIADKEEAFLHRFYIRADKKRQGIGTALLQVAEDAMLARGITHSHVHLGGEAAVWFESYKFYPKHGYAEYAPRYLCKNLA